MLGSDMKTETTKTMGCMYSCIKKTNMLVPTCEYISMRIHLYTRDHLCCIVEYT